MSEWHKPEAAEGVSFSPHEAIQSPRCWKRLLSTIAAQRFVVSNGKSALVV
jgi:hypothetical protein